MKPYLSSLLLLLCLGLFRNQGKTQDKAIAVHLPKGTLFTELPDTSHYYFKVYMNATEIQVNTDSTFQKAKNIFQLPALYNKFHDATLLRIHKPIQVVLSLDSTTSYEQSDLLITVLFLRSQRFMLEGLNDKNEIRFLQFYETSQTDQEKSRDCSFFEEKTGRKLSSNYSGGIPPPTHHTILDLGDPFEKLKSSIESGDFQRSYLIQVGQNEIKFNNKPSNYSEITQKIGESTELAEVVIAIKDNASLQEWTGMVAHLKNIKTQNRNSYKPESNHRLLRFGIGILSRYRMEYLGLQH